MREPVPRRTRLSIKKNRRGPRLRETAILLERKTGLVQTGSRKDGSGLKGLSERKALQRRVPFGTLPLQRLHSLNFRIRVLRMPIHRDDLPRNHPCLIRPQKHRHIGNVARLHK